MFGQTRLCICVERQECVEGETFVCLWEVKQVCVCREGFGLERDTEVWVFVIVGKCVCVYGSVETGLWVWRERKG